MCMTLVLSEPMTRAVASGACRLEWSNFTECVVTYVVTRTSANQRFSGVISTAVLHYVDVRPETRLSVYVPQLCLALVVLLVNGWLLVSLQGGGGIGATRASRNRPITLLLLSLTAAYGLQGAVNVYTMTSLVASSLAPNPLYRNQARECLTANSFLLVSILAALFHQVALAGDRLHSACRPMSYRTFWTRVRVRLLVGGLWSVSILLAFLPLMGWKPRFAYCIFFYQYPRGYLHLLTAVFVVASAVTAAQHAYVALRTGSASRGAAGAGAGTFAVNGGGGGGSSKSWSRARRRRDARLTSTAAILGVLSAVLWTPLFLHLSLACPQCAARSDNDFILLGVFAFALTNALLAPLVYAFRLKQLRHLVSDVVARWSLCRGVGRRSGSFELGADGGVVREVPRGAERAAGKQQQQQQQQQQQIKQHNSLASAYRNNEGVSTISGMSLSTGRNLTTGLQACPKRTEMATSARRQSGTASPAANHSTSDMANGDFLY